MLFCNGENMMSRDEYINSICEINKNNETISPQWSERLYRCPKCNGGMRKNLWGCICIATLPPIYKSEYRCDECGFKEYLKD